MLVKSYKMTVLVSQRKLPYTQKTIYFATRALNMQRYNQLLLNISEFCLHTPPCAFMTQCWAHF